MSYYCDICDKKIYLTSKNKHLKSIIHKELEKFFRIVHCIDNPNFLALVIYITNLITFTIKNTIVILSNVILM